MDKALEYLQALESSGSEFASYEKENFRQGIVRPMILNPVTNNPVTPISPVPGQLRSGTIVGEFNLRIVRTSTGGGFNAQTAVIPLGCSNAMDNAYRRVINSLLPAGQQYVGYTEDAFANNILFTFFDGSVTETIQVTSDTYDVVALFRALRNNSALVTGTSVTTPNVATIIQQFQANPMITFKQTWLTDYTKQQNTIRLSSGQFNANIFDIANNYELSNDSGVAFYIPSTGAASTTHVYNVQLYIGKIARI